jgi:tetratricopeptide (TPR) repeat protein
MSDQGKSGPGLPKPKMQTMSRHTLQAQQAAPAQKGRTAPAAKDEPSPKQPAPAEAQAQEEPGMSEDEFEAWAAENPEEAENLERITIGMAKGEISPAEAYGFSIEDMAEAAVLGSEQYEKGNLESAVIIFEGLVTAEPKIPQFRVSLGQCYEKLGFNEEALEAYASALILYAAIGTAKIEEIMDPAMLRAGLLIRLGRELEAIEDLTRVVPPDLDVDQAPPVMVQAYVMLYNLLEKAAKDEEEAAKAAAAAAPPAEPPPQAPQA